MSLDDPLYAIGLDVGGTKIAAGVVGFPSGRVYLRQVVPTLPRRGGEAVLTDCLALAEQLASQAADPRALLGIGLAVAELVDLAGNVTSSHTISWRGMPVQERLSRLAPAVVESDVRAGAWGEARFGAGQASELFLYVTVGTGISHSLVQHGRPYTGARGNALICASSPLTTTCTECGTRLEPILDDMAAGPALVARYNQASQKTASRGQEVLAAAAAGDPAAVAVVRSGAEALGVTLGFLVNVLDPERVIIGGGLGVAGGLYWDSCITATRAHIWSDTNRDLPIVRAALGVDAGLIGAAVAAWERFH